MIAVGVSVEQKVAIGATVKNKIATNVSIVGRERIIDMPHDSIEEIYTAGENISSGNVLMLEGGQVFKYQASDENNYGKAIGIAKNAALIGTAVTVVLSGRVNIVGWGLTPDDLYYAGDNGDVSHSPPSTGLLNLIGIAKDSNTMIVDIDEPIIL